MAGRDETERWSPEAIAMWPRGLTPMSLDQWKDLINTIGSNSIDKPIDGMSDDVFNLLVELHVNGWKTAPAGRWGAALFEVQERFIDAQPWRPRSLASWPRWIGRYGFTWWEEQVSRSAGDYIDFDEENGLIIDSALVKYLMCSRGVDPDQWWTFYVQDVAEKLYCDQEFFFVKNSIEQERVGDDDG